MGTGVLMCDKEVGKGLNSKYTKIRRLVLFETRHTNANKPDSSNTKQPWGAD
jgi:hypothetical protein